MDCVLVPAETKHRSIHVVSRRWDAADSTKGCADYMPKARALFSPRGDKQAESAEPVAVQPARKARWYERLIRRKQRST